MSAEGWGLGFHWQEHRVGVGRKKWRLGPTRVLDSGGGVSGELAQPPGPSPSQGPGVPVTVIPSPPSRNRLLVPTSLPSGPGSPKLLQEC